MGMDLHGAGGEFHWTGWQWSALLELAMLYGWTPIGTAEPNWCDGDGEPVRRSESWSGTYCSNDYQQVRDEDAAALAAALASALDDVPDVEPVHKLMSIPCGDRVFVGVNPDAPELTVLEHFAGPGGKHALRSFISYCRAGGFSIG
jgi:hypothetical protein